MSEKRIEVSRDNAPDVFDELLSGKKSGSGRNDGEEHASGKSVEAGEAGVKLEKRKGRKGKEAKESGAVREEFRTESGREATRFEDEETEIVKPKKAPEGPVELEVKESQRRTLERGETDKAGTKFNKKTRRGV